ncbi:MAG: AAA family ATPase [Thermoflavifilum sp.]|nr:AAA family ATPase [Thermoflavifilum sp.]MCL6515034.1 AAA family ATPase [Alicyclobacillus sp.]
MELPFVGRQVEFSILHELWARACSGRMQAILITGEAGIGKSRFVEEFTRRVKEHNAGSRVSVWLGKAQAIGRGLTFSSLFEVLRVAIEDLSPEQRRRFAEKYPYLSVFCPELGEPTAPYRAARGLERTWLFETLRRFVVDLTELQPAVLWIDDLPEADDDTLDWLEYLFRHTEHCRLFFIGTCRTQAPGAENSYYAVAESAWVQKRHIEHMVLGPLQASEADELITSSVGHNVDEEVRRYVRNHADGNPLFILEMLRMVAENVGFDRAGCLPDISQFFKSNVPRQIGAIIASRINGMPGLERTIMRFIAVSASALPWTILARVIVGVDEDSLAAALSNLVRADLLRETGSDYDVEYEFRHPLIKATVYQQLSRIEIRQTHKALAAGWRGDIARFAYHVRQAGSLIDAREAIPVLYDAGQYYMSLRAYQSACEYLERAWNMMKTPSISIAKEQMVNIQLALAEAYTYLDRKAEAIALLDALYLHEVDINLRIRIKRMLVWITSIQSPEESTRHIEEGLRYWDGITANEDVFWMMKQRVENTTNVGDITRAKKYVAELRDYMERFPDDRNSIALKCHEVVIHVVDWKTQPWKDLDRDRWLNRALELGDPEALYEVYCVFGYHALNVGDFLTTIRYASDCVKWMRRFGMVQHEISIRLMLLCGLFLAGRWREAVVEAQDVKNLAADHHATVAVLCVLDFLALLFAVQGHWESSRTCTKEAMQLAESVSPIHPVIQSGQTVTPAEAVMILVGQQPQPEQPMSVVWANTHGLPVFLTMLQGILHTRTGATEFVSRSVAELRRVVGARRPNYLEGVADLLGGLLAKTQGDTTRALELVKNAYSTFERLATPFEAAIAQLSWAYLARYRYPRQAVAEAERSRVKFEGLGAAPFAKFAQTLLAPLGVEPQSTPKELSAREWEIVQSVARGLSNKQIAETLMISPRTVSTHLEKIYKKLDVHSRTELISKLNR